MLELLCGHRAVLLRHLHVCVCVCVCVSQGTKVIDACDAAGVRAFPTWVINGKVVEGQLTLDALEAELASTEPVTPQRAPSPFAEAQ